MRALKYALAASLLVAAPAAVAQQQLSIATGGTGGTYYPYGGGLAELIKEHIDGYDAVAEVTGASVENMGLVWRGDSDMALALADTVYQAITAPATSRAASSRTSGLGFRLSQRRADRDHGRFRHRVPGGSRGKIVSVGAPGSGTELNARAVLESNGISYDDFEARRLNFNETADAIRDGDIDAGFWSVGPPTSSIMNLATTRDIRLIGLSDEEVANAREEVPVFAPYELRADLYEGMEEPVQTIGIPNILATNARWMRSWPIRSPRLCSSTPIS